MVKDEIKKQNKIVGAKMKELRQSKHQSMNYVYKIAGVSKSYLSRIEHGLSSPSYDTLKRLAGSYNMPLADMINVISGRPKKTKYKHVPVIKASTGNPIFAIHNTTDYEPELPDEVPKHCFYVRINENVKHRGYSASRVLVNQDYNYQVNKLYACYIHDEIKIGRIYKNPNNSCSVLITNTGAFFNTKSNRTYTILGSVVGAITSPLITLNYTN